MSSTPEELIRDLENIFFDGNKESDWWYGKGEFSPH
jgi:hypothetical protein